MESSDEEPRFDFSEGAGERLGSLPCFTAVGTRGKAAEALEKALEHVHRFVYGRAGVLHARRAALEDFRGCPPSMQSQVEARVAKLKGPVLRDIIVALGLDVKLSAPLNEKQAGVVQFLMAPKDGGRIKDPKVEAEKKEKEKAKAAKKAAAKASTSPSKAGQKRAAAESAGDDKAEGEAPAAPAAKKAKKDVSPAPRTEKLSTADKVAATRPSEAEVLVEVYRRVLAMTVEQRATLGVKALRTEVEAHFRLPDGALKSRKDAITAAATECVAALRVAEERAVAGLQAPAEAAPEAGALKTEDDKKADEAPHPLPATTTTTAAGGEAAATVAANTEVGPAEHTSAPSVSHVAPMHPGVTPL